jgi:hypothetical protein
MSEFAGPRGPSSFVSESFSPSESGPVPPYRTPTQRARVVRPPTKKTRDADEQVAVKESERVAWVIAQQLRERTAALKLTRLGVIRSCLGARDGEALDARGEYRFLRVFKGDALPDPTELMLLAAALDCSVSALLEGIDPARVELLRQIRVLRRLSTITDELPVARAA